MPDVGVREDLWRRLLALPARQRAVLVLRYYEDLSERDTAEVLGCTVAAVKSLASRGTVDSTRPPSAGSVAIAWQGIVMSSACGAPDTSGAVMSEIIPFGPGACGQAMVAVDCLTGSSGTSAHSTIPAMPATTATSRAMADTPVRSDSSRGTRVDVRRRS